MSGLLLYKAELIKDINNKLAQSIKNIDNSDGLCIKLTDWFKQVHNILYEAIFYASGLSANNFLKNVFQVRKIILLIKPLCIWPV